MKIRCVALALSALFSFLSLDAQDTITISVPLTLTLQEESTGKIVSIAETDPPVLVGIPKGLDTLLYWSFVSSGSQNIYDQYKKGRISEEAFLEKKISPESYTDEEINFKIYGLSGFRNGKKIIVMDTNHNLDFSDERVLELDTTLTLEERLADDYRLCPWMNITLDYYENGKVHTISSTGRIDPFVMLMAARGTLEEDLKFSFYTFENYRGTLSLGDKKYNFLMDRGAASGFPDDLLFFNYGLYPDEQEDIFYPINFGQKIFINNTQLELTAFDRESNSVTFTQFPLPTDQMIFGGRVGMKAPSYTAKVVGKEDSIRVGGAKEHYQFLHAWGTWCGPCIGDHDELIRLYRNYHGDNLEFIGLAVDKDETTISAYTKKKGMEWDNIFFTRRDAFRNTSILTQQFYVNAYPTYMIIDPQGMVVARGKLDELEPLLLEIKNGR
ncbi:TlpA family protein disulfide reductase [Flavilitoribacter nigricans]|uniref:Thioredoxin domain-containing protein n=1 Tax=Flavilitoribacter nigricans (strain ATCC 23147 / DSM 23189 / NBRC 102662 / NCIMB 1420 / SS-2) TaxID=1122177 RepID=A0A2D0MYJ8_FLAN2|nr:TlpA disulfide reductase family protein [Flavilitoribacter nigricans]PHN01208.1 hypothetical protein CRP01_38355 [Flavilitoribacter nigricans DSM 23189 = NBRC 102662]